VPRAAYVTWIEISNPTLSHAGPRLLVATLTMLRATQLIDIAIYLSLT
jgi:hypothetical protein